MDFSHFNGYPSRSGDQSHHSNGGQQSQHYHQQHHQHSHHLPNLSTQRYVDHHADHQTLPPINGIPMQYQQHLGQAVSAPHTTLPPHAPSTTLAPSRVLGYSQSVSQPPLQTLQPPPGSYGHAAPYPGPSSTAPSVTATYVNPRGYVTAPLPNRLHDIRPRPRGASGLSAPYDQPQLLVQPPVLSNQEPEPTHVVGQQGRRGVLPSSQGRPAPGPGKAIVPTKNADGKFPCPYCPKTYLHAKHLKRHLLRHTGDRPYQCKLCKDTFSRSDILKRHFQKCSLRRGVPGDTDHLEGSRAHLNRNRLSGGSTSASTTSAPAAYTNGLLTNHALGAAGVMSDQHGYVDNLSSARSSRSSSIIRPGTGSGSSDNRRDLSSFDQFPLGRSSLDASQGFAVATTLAGGLGHGQTAYSMPPAQSASGMNQSLGYGHSLVTDTGPQPNGRIESGHKDHMMFDHSTFGNMDTLQNGHGQDHFWENSYDTGGQEGFLFPSSMSMGSDVTKAETGLLSGNLLPSTTMSEETMFSGLYSSVPGYAVDHLFEGWEIGDPMQRKLDDMISFCFPGGSSRTADEVKAEAELRNLLTLENTKHFLDGYKHYHNHWPVLHMPTFNPLQAHSGLLLAILSVGAIYSDKLDKQKVRWLAEIVRRAVQRSSRAYGSISSPSRNNANGVSHLFSDIEELQAVLLVHIIFTWNGNQLQRTSARADFWKIAAIARQTGLLYPIGPGQPGYSVLHQPGSNVEQHELAAWDWEAWVEQEKRSRLMYIIYLLDAAETIFFNTNPHFEPQEMRLPLPADDAAWEAKNAAECAGALGLRGRDFQEKNVTGSRRAKQIEFWQAMKLLMSSTNDFKPRTTNVYSKLILIHALHVQIWNVLRQPTQGIPPNGFGMSSSGPSTPLSQNDWVAPDGSNSSLSNSTSGRGTPTDSLYSQYSHGSHQPLKALYQAVEKWKRAWDTDMPLQYPQCKGALRRVGACRDGIQFYHLAIAILRGRHAINTSQKADVHFAHVMRLFKNISNHVAKDAEQNGMEFGSAAEIADKYGVEDLTLNMRLLLPPMTSN